MEHNDSHHVFSPQGDASAFELDGYEAITEVARTRLSTVYRAVQTSTQQRVALKVLNSGPGTNRKALARFEREIDLLIALRHPNIVPIYDAGRAGGHYYFVMPFIEGQPPDAYVVDHALCIAERLRLMCAVCRAVHFAHQRGIIHRDLKPSNMIVDAAGEPHVFDFGLGKILHGEEGQQDLTLTLDGAQVMGTPAYMSPEHALGWTAAVDVRTDVYSLGVILYRLLTGEMPYPTDGGLTETLRYIEEMNPRRPHVVNRDLDRDIDVMLLKAMEKDPEHRYQSAGELASDIERYLDGKPLLARPPSLSYRTAKFFRRHRLASLSAAAIVLLLCGLGGASWRAWRAEVNERRSINEVKGVLGALFQQGIPEDARGRDVLFHEVLDNASASFQDPGNLALFNMDDRPLMVAAVFEGYARSSWQDRRLRGGGASDATGAAGPSSARWDGKSRYPAICQYAGRLPARSRGS